MSQEVRKQARLTWPGRLFWLLVLLSPIMVLAASATKQITSAGKQIVDEAVNASDADTMRLELRFVLPVNYLWHFPHTPKDEFLIAIQPIQALSDYNLDIREHIRIPPEMANIITDLSYDGTETNGQFIVLKTNRKVGISVKQGVGGRNLMIEFNSIAPEPASECEDDGKPKKDAK